MQGFEGEELINTKQSEMGEFIFLHPFEICIEATQPQVLACT